jgi:hypothetical protein
MGSIAYKEIDELLTGAELAVQAFQELMADGKVDFKDLAVLIKMSRQLQAFNAAVQGLQNLTLAALASLTPEEIEQLVAKLMRVLGSFGLLAKGV